MPKGQLLFKINTEVKVVERVLDLVALDGPVQIVGPGDISEEPHRDVGKVEFLEYVTFKFRGVDSLMTLNKSIKDFSYEESSVITAVLTDFLAESSMVVKASAKLSELGRGSGDWATLHAVKVERKGNFGVQKIERLSMCSTGLLILNITLQMLEGRADDEAAFAYSTTSHD